eukprot:TRINITY_DN12492_c0_g1_i1.p1 TRINITY_DN12492_c0_g1~~TRINITY_DN12492_c0_g1_i1.p1  ORF type:complete len:1056 (+),score=245.34 TRINITY_DN12492_c0_g1_i1:120-3170(+)
MAQAPCTDAMSAAAASADADALPPPAVQVAEPSPRPAATATTSARTAYAEGWGSWESEFQRLCRAGDGAPAASATAPAQAAAAAAARDGRQVRDGGEAARHGSSLKVVAAVLEAHARSAKALAEAASRSVSSADERRALLASLTTFEGSLLDVHRDVLDAIGDLAVRLVEAPPRSWTTPTPVSPAQAKAEAAEAVVAVDDAGGSAVAAKTASASSASSAAPAPVEEAAGKTAGAAEVDASAVSRRVELLELVAGMLQKKWDTLVLEEATGQAHQAKLTDLREDIRRVDAELAAARDAAAAISNSEATATPPPKEGKPPQKATSELAKGARPPSSPEPLSGAGPSPGACTATPPPGSSANALATPNSAATTVATAAASTPAVATPDSSAAAVPTAAPTPAASTPAVATPAVETPGSAETAVATAATSTPAVAMVSEASAEGNGTAASEAGACSTDAGAESADADAAAGAEPSTPRRAEQKEEVPSTPLPRRDAVPGAAGGERSRTSAGSSSAQAPAICSSPAIDALARALSLSSEVLIGSAREGVGSTGGTCGRYIRAACTGAASSTCVATTTAALAGLQASANPTPSPGPRTPKTGTGGAQPLLTDSSPELPAPGSRGESDAGASSSDDPFVVLGGGDAACDVDWKRSPIQQLPGEAEATANSHASAVVAGGNAAEEPRAAGAGAQRSAIPAAQSNGYRPAPRKAPAAPQAGSSALLLSPPPQAASSLRAATTPGKRRVPASFGASALFRETPSPRAGMPMRDRSSPVRAPPLPRSLFASPSPPRYAQMSGTAFDGMTDNRPHALPPRAPAQTTGLSNSAENGGSAAAAAGEAPATPVPKRRGSRAESAGARTGGEQFFESAPPPRLPPGTPATPTTPAFSEPPAARTPSPAQQRAAGASAQRFNRSPSAPIIALGVPMAALPKFAGGRGCSGAVTDAALGAGSAAGAVGNCAGDTPRNHTDWRRSLQMARRRQDSDPRPAPATPPPPSPSSHRRGSGGHLATASPAPAAALPPWR